MMKDEILNLFSEAGWYPDRKIDISYMVDELKKGGYTLPNESICKLLEEFGNLKVEFSQQVYIDVRFNVSMGIGSAEPEGCKIYKNIVGDYILPIGTMCSDAFVLWVTYSRKFYAGDGEYLIYLGEGLFSTMSCIFESGFNDDERIVYYKKYM